LIWNYKPRVHAEQKILRDKAGLLALFLSLSAPVFLCASAIRAQAFAQATATLTGRISVAGVYPRVKALPVFKNRDFCGRSVTNESLLIGHDGGIKYAAVVLRALDRPTAAKPKQLVLDNQHCAFVPHVQVAPVGSEVLLMNSDPILHTVHARLGRETLFNVGLPRWRTVTKRLDRAGVVRIDCDVLHTWMSAAIVITDSPYYALSDEQGMFSIEGLPFGNYQMEIWHERLGSRIQELQVNNSGLPVFDVVFSAEKIR
jgi:plastocyanin